MPNESLVDLYTPQSVDRCAWYMRVSTPRQKLEHQREPVVRFCDQHGICVPEEFRFEDKEKRHKSAKRPDFQRLLDVVKAGQLDWIIICSFDRWGVADVDEFFEFRRLLIKHEVRLWSVVDQMNMTGITEGDYFRVVAMAIGASKYVEQMAEKNILKMVEMVKHGWAGTGNAPYGTDLVCYPLHDTTRPLFRVVRTRYIRPHAYRVLHYTPESRVERDQAGVIVAHHLAVAKEEVVERMPPRDKKATGYRFEPSIEEDRMRAVRLAFDLYDSGMGFREISRSLWGQGLKHYDKPFSYHGIEVILANPAYLGLPGWGKIGVGAYRILHNGGPVKVKRKASDTYVIKKDESQCIQPLRPVFKPIVPVDLWQRVHDRLKDRGHTNPNYGKRRTRSRVTHPLNGKLFCPDCDQPMVLGSSMPAVGSRGKKTRCFNCGTYRRFSRLKCHANTVGWDRLDAAVEELLDAVKGRIDGFIANPLSALMTESWAKDCELTRLLGSIDGELKSGTPEELAALNEPPPSEDVRILDIVFEAYNRMHARRTQEIRGELEGINQELARIGNLLLEGIPSQTVKKQLFGRMTELEAKKRQLEPQLVPLTARAETVIDQLKAIQRTIEASETVEIARLLDKFIEKVIPRFDVQIVGPSRQRRAVLRSVEFIPRQNEAARTVLPQAMEIGANRTGRGSSRPPARSWPGKSSSAARARW